MASLDLQLLKERAEKDYDALKARKRRAYQLARQLGFSPSEAKLLSGYSQEHILRLARERASGGT